MARYNQTEAEGISEVHKIVASQLRWVYRPIPENDVGIDALVEQSIEPGYPTGKLIALQIKSGPSHATEGENAFTFYGDGVHRDCWLG